MSGAQRADLWHSWLPLAIPASATRFSVDNDAIAATLAAAGADLVTEGAHADIGRPRTARWVAVPVEADLPQRRLRALRGGVRAVRGAGVRLRAARIAASLRRRGYEAEVLTWEPGLPVGFGGASRRARGVRERLPLRAVVVGRREVQPSLLEAVLAEVGSTAPARALSVRARGGLVLAFADRGVVRVGVGPAAAKLERQARALAALDALSPSDDIRTLVPWQLEAGRTGIGHWALERALEGRTASAPEGDAFFQSCVEFLVALFRAGRGGREPRLERFARAVASVAPDDATALERLAARLEERFATLPRGFAHGDFGLPNLLESGGRLSGVVDWEAAGDGRLPFLDLFHLYVEDRLGPREELGEALVRHLLPWARRGGPPWASEYAGRLGLRAEPEILSALAAAWWLDVIGYAIEQYDPATRWRRDWVERNVGIALRGLREQGLLER